MQHHQLVEKVRDLEFIGGGNAGLDVPDHHADAVFLVEGADPETRNVLGEVGKVGLPRAMELLAAVRRHQGHGRSLRMLRLQCRLPHRYELLLHLDAGRASDAEKQVGSAAVHHQFQ